jgi:predicted phosphoribosyltransferase
LRANVIEDPRLRNRSGVFEDREEAGFHLAEALEEFRGKEAIVLAIPSGGVPVGLAISSRLGLDFDLMIIRKIPIPGNPEAGFGALSLEGDTILNWPLVRMLRLSSEEIELLARPVKEELRARNQLFRGGRARPELRGRTIILVDDGLASGYTMRAAVQMARRQGPAGIVVAVPTAPLDAVEMLAEEVDGMVCLNVRSESSFAVADAYRNWYDLSREEVLGLLGRHGLLPSTAKDESYGM